MLVQDIAGLYIPQHDYISLTYVAAGNGVGEIETFFPVTMRAIPTVSGVTWSKSNSSTPLNESASPNANSWHWTATTSSGGAGYARLTNADFDAEL